MDNNSYFEKFSSFTVISTFLKVRLRLGINFLVMLPSQLDFSELDYVHLYSNYDSIHVQLYRTLLCHVPVTLSCGNSSSCSNSHLVVAVTLRLPLCRYWQQLLELERAHAADARALHAACLRLARDLLADSEVRIRVHIRESIWRLMRAVAVMNWLSASLAHYV